MKVTEVNREVNMKILSVAVPCYNSEQYMDKCIESLLVGGDDVEILVVDDGSSDNTASIADDYANRYPNIIKAIHQPNGGHGSAVNTGMANATGYFFKVVDSDDWVDEESYKRIISFLKQSLEADKKLDMLISNYVYEKVGAKHKKVMKPSSGFPKDRYFTWNDVGIIQKGHYLLMHSIIYRTELLRECGLQLPKHTFYVDNIYAFQPLPYVKTMYYLDVDFYRYFIGRDDQSVNMPVMVKRIDQQMRVNKLMVDCFHKSNIASNRCSTYMRNYLEIITIVSCVVSLYAGNPDGVSKRKELWQYIYDNDRDTYYYLRRSLLVMFVNLPGYFGRKTGIAGEKIVRKFIGFN